MSEFHFDYPVNSSAELMYAIYRFVADASQDVVDFVVDNGETAIWADKDEAGGAPDEYVTSVSSADAFLGTNCFMVLEVQFNNPGGRAWQVKINRASTTSISVEGSPNGGWTIVNSTSGATDSFGAEPTTGARPWLNVLPSAGDSVYISSSDGDTYDSGSKKYGYIRAIHYDVSADNFGYGFYVGGYIPLDVTNDTDPFLLLAGVPAMSESTSSGTTDWWGRTATGTSNENRIPRENGQATSSMVSAGYAAITSNPSVISSARGRTRMGNEVSMQIFVHGIGDNVCVGTLGAEVMVGITAGTAERQANALKDRIAVNNIGIRWRH